MTAIGLFIVLQVLVGTVCLLSCLAALVASHHLLFNARCFAAQSRDGAGGELC